LFNIEMMVQSRRSWERNVNCAYQEDPERGE